MTWSRQPVAQALVNTITAAAPPGTYVHERPPETLNPIAIVIMRPVTVSYATGGLSIDEVELPIAIVSGLEQDDAIDSVKTTVRNAIAADPTLAGTVQRAWPLEERNWRNVIGAGGIDLLYVELIIHILM